MNGIEKNDWYYNIGQLIDSTTIYNVCDISCGVVMPKKKHVDNKEVKKEIPLLNSPTVEAEKKLLNE